MLILYDYDNQRRITASGGQNLSSPSINYQAQPVIDFNFKNVASGPTITARDVSDAMTWAFALDKDKNIATAPMCRTLSVNIDKTNAAAGQILIPVDANTPQFLAAVNGQTGNITVYFELKGFSAAGKQIYYIQFTMQAGMIVDAAETPGPDTPDNLVTEAQAYALLMSAPAYQYSTNAVEAHDTQTSADLYRRERRLSGAWSAWTALIPPVAAQYQYSINGSTDWHSPYAAGDYYLRISTDGGATYGNAVLFRYDAANAFVYVAYASDDSGTGWSLTPAVTLRYRTEIHSATVLTPVEADFAAATYVLYIIGKFWSEAGVPDSGLGENGDNYLNKNNGDVYYKSAGAWSIICNIRGPAFSVSASGLLIAKSTYDAEAAGFSYLATDTGNLYIKNSATSGDWSAAIPFKGDKGDAATISIGTVATVAPGAPATVNNGGTSSAAILNFNIPAGAPGEAGATPLFISGPFDSTDLTVGILTITHAQGLLKGLPCMVSYEISSGVWESHTLDSQLVQFSNNQIEVDLSVFDIQAGQNWHYSFGGCGGVGEQGPPGDGDVNGPASAVDAQIAVFDGTTGKLLKDSGQSVSSVQSEAVATAKTASFNAQTDSYTLVIGDAGKVVIMTKSSANALTIPANSSVAFATGTMIAVIMNGSGTTSITASAGVSIDGVTAGTGAISGQYKGVMLIKTGTNTWLVLGAIGTIA